MGDIISTKDRPKLTKTKFKTKYILPTSLAVIALISGGFFIWQNNNPKANAVESVQDNKVSTNKPVEGATQKPATSKGDDVAKKETTAVADASGSAKTTTNNTTISAPAKTYVAPKPTPKPAAKPAPAPAITTIAGAQAYTEGVLLQLINNERTSHGVAALSYNSLLGRAADIRVAEEAITSFVGVDHTRPNGTSYSTVLGQVGYYGTAWGENLVWGYQQNFAFSQSTLNTLANKMFTNWKNSPGHYANMMKATFNQTGFGVVIKIQGSKLYYFGIEEFGRK